MEIGERSLEHEFSRTELLLGSDAMERLYSSSVIVFGVGGVGSYTVEALARSGIGHIGLVDNDTVCQSNINRQLIATHKSIGCQKVDVAKERIADINPKAKVTTYPVFYGTDTVNTIDLTPYDYIVDAIDTVSAKLLLIQQAHELGIPIISSMGAGNKLDPARFEIADIYKTSMCPLARVMRYELRKRGIPKLTVVYSKEEALTPIPPDAQAPSSGKRVPGSIAFVPSTAGLILAGHVIRTLAGV